MLRAGCHIKDLELFACNKSCVQQTLQAANATFFLVANQLAVYISTFQH